MDGETSTGNDRSRTYWTPAMERYFIDLMLEQMHKGNRVGHTFSKQAWEDMINLFNTRFGSQYDKDVLKSRYTNLWKQFHDVKNLLGQSGFSWDESQQMVVADTSTWDDYIKLNPDVRSYKSKPVLNFTDLCLIYGYASAYGMYSRSSHDDDFDHGVQGVIEGDVTGSLASSTNERLKTDWTPIMDQYFIELLLDQIGRGNKINSSFNKQAWTDMLASFNARFSQQHGKRVLSHRYRKLWKYYADMKILLHNGFSWDETQKMITADVDTWNAYIKAHPHARIYRSKVLPNYNDLHLIFANVSDDSMCSPLSQSKDLESDTSIAKTGEGKGRQCPTGSDRTRTYWTPVMDHYLIDLLLEQVHKGNKVGQTFISQAWVEMVTSFNAYFESHHDREVLKNRYKHLRRQYNDIKSLLDQRGFSWDETQEMVKAEDCVWDAYIKEHPDARSYRVKTVPSYEKLCVIFGRVSYDERYSHLAHAQDANVHKSVVVGEERNPQSPVISDRLDISWTPSMDRHFVDIMLEQVSNGNKIDQTFNEQAWTPLVKSFNEKFQLQLNKDALGSRYIYLTKQHADIRNLLNHYGFTWDETRQTVAATKDVWEKYIKEHPAAVIYRDTSFPFYSDLSKICAARISDGRYSNHNPGMETKHSVSEREIERVAGDKESPEGNTDDANRKRKQPSTLLTESEPSTKEQKIINNMNEALSEMAGMVSKLVRSKDSSTISIERAIDALQAIPDIDEELLLDACDLLEDEKKAKTFLALDVTLRKKWLLRKLRPQGQCF